MKKRPKLKWGKKGYLLVNAVGGAGYLVALLGYIIFASLVFMVILPELNASNLITGKTPLGGDPTPITSDPSVLSTIITYSVAAVALVLSIFIFIMLPYWIGKTGGRTVKSILRLLRLSPGLLNTYVVKVCLSLVPFLLTTMLVMISTVSFGFELLIATAIVAFMAVVIFSIQSIMAVIKNRHVELIW